MFILQNNHRAFNNSFRLESDRVGNVIVFFFFCDLDSTHNTLSVIRMLPVSVLFKNFRELFIYM